MKKAPAVPGLNSGEPGKVALSVRHPRRGELRP